MPAGQQAWQGVSQGSAGHHPTLALLVKSSWLWAPLLVPLPRGQGRAAVAQRSRQKTIVFSPATSLGPRARRQALGGEGCSAWAQLFTSRLVPSTHRVEQRS